MSTLVEELEQAAEAAEHAMTSYYNASKDLDALELLAARLRQRAAWVRDTLEARWKRDRYQYGPSPSFREEADKRLGTLLLLTGPIPAAETAPTERTP